MNSQTYQLTLLVALCFLHLSGAMEAGAQQLSPAMIFSPSIIDFGTIEGCSRAPEKTVRLINTGNTPLDVRIPKSGSQPFFLSVPDSRVYLFPGDSAEVTVIFSTVDPGIYADTIRVVDTENEATATLQVSASLDAVGYALSPGVLDIHEPDWQAGESVDTSFVFRNFGTGDLTLIAAETRPPFLVLSPPLPVTVPPGEEQTIRVRFAPEGEGEWQSSLSAILTVGNCTDTARSLIFASAGESNAVPDNGEVTEYSWGAIGYPQPNPAADRVFIPLDLYRSADVCIEVLDIEGRRIDVLTDGRLQAGLHRFEWQPDRPGSYMIRLVRDGITIVRPVIVVR